MTNIYATLNLDSGSAQIQSFSVYTQYDTGRYLHLYMYSAGAALELTGETYTLYALKPDGNLYSAECSLGDDSNELIISAEEQLTPVAGNVKCEIRVDDSYTLGEFVLFIRPSIADTGTLSESSLESIYAAIEDAAASATEEITGYVSEAAESASSAETSAESAAASAVLAESYAVGGTGTRDGEDEDNAKYYAEQAATSAAAAETAQNGAETAGGECSAYAENAANSATSAAESAESAAAALTALNEAIEGLVDLSEVGF